LRHYQQDAKPYAETSERSNFFPYSDCSVRSFVADISESQLNKDEMQASKANQQVTKVPRFLQSLYEILHNEDQNILTWSADGAYFQVLDVARLEREVLPKYFKHGKFTSFQRQLNNFSFRKWTKTRANVCTFSHDVLVRCAYLSELTALSTKYLASKKKEAEAAVENASTPVVVALVPTLKRQRSDTCMGSTTAAALKSKIQKTVAGSPSASSDVPIADIFFVAIDDLAIDSNWSLNTLDLADLWALDFTQCADDSISTTDDAQAMLGPLAIELELELDLEYEDIDVATQLDWSNAVTDACLAVLDSEAAVVVVVDCKPTTVLGTIDTELDILDLAF
uniref:HSF-type DNA-binding domain-containing protein n=1 Tax=Globisporangium ultimum (strain ATCC 200006 / CBS 805.95 / DAOM BR144) TaxID=431595 RepID=K3WRA8_GLOUD